MNPALLAVPPGSRNEPRLDKRTRLHKGPNSHSAKVHYDPQRELPEKSRWRSPIAGARSAFERR